MAKIAQEYCNECRKDTWHEYIDHNKWQLLTKCDLCGSNFDLIPDGQVFIDEAGGEKIRMPYA